MWLHRMNCASLLSRDMSPMDWQRPAGELVNQVRGLIPWPCAATDVAGVQWKVFRAHAGEETGSAPGTILSADKNGVAVACGDGRALVLDLVCRNFIEYFFIDIHKGN